MDRFIVFGGQDYYPCGGWRDIVGYAETIREAKAMVDVQLSTDQIEWWQIVDTGTGVIIDNGPRRDLDE
jgi:hypothetical protein